MSWGGASGRCRRFPAGVRGPGALSSVSVDCVSCSGVVFSGYGVGRGGRGWASGESRHRLKLSGSGESSFR